MVKGNSSLAALREQLDRIDEQLHDLIMERAGIAERVRLFKQSQSVWRPAREAQILRKLLDRHKGPFPIATICQIWREIISAMVRLQTDFVVAVHAPEKNRKCRDLARNHFGIETPIIMCASANAVLTAVQEGSATVGVLPYPEDEEQNPWWAVLKDMANSSTAVCAKLPLLETATENSDSALCIAGIDSEDSGRDYTICIVRTKTKASRSRISQVIAATGIRPIRIIARGLPQDGFSEFFTVLEGFAGPGDARLARLSDQNEGIADSVIVLGHYAQPLRTDDISSMENVS
tara:strand:+ start:484 stop:1356 length:873 start_codon:yes stop_codon:yes gene_type:complete